MKARTAIAIGWMMAACWAATATVCHASNEGVSGASPAMAQTNSPAASAPAVPRRLEEEELRGLLLAALHRLRADDSAEWELTFTRPWTPVAVPEGPLCAEVVEPAVNRITPTCVLRFDLRAGRKLLGSWQAQIQAHLWSEVLVARSSLHRSQPLEPADFARERRDLLTLREPLFELPSHNAGYELAESVPAGSVLSAHAIRLKPVLLRGQLADAVIRDGTMMISLKVEVLEEGVPGQIVRVRNAQTHRELRGKVLDEQTIAIPL